MATTVTIDDQAAEIARSFAESQGTSIDQAVTTLIIQHGTKPSTRPQPEAFRPLPKHSGSSVLTSKMVYAALDNEA